MGPLSRLARSRMLLLSGFLLVCLVSCAVNEEDLAKWKSLREGEARLAGYLASPERPVELRAQAARHLFDMGKAGHIAATLAPLDEDDRRTVLEPILVGLASRFTASQPHEATQAKDLLYALLPHTKKVDGVVLDAVLGKFMAWAQPLVGAPAAPPGRSVGLVITAAGLLHPGRIAMPIKTELRFLEDPKRILALVELTSAFGTPKVKVEVADVLLYRTRQIYPKLTDEHVLAMKSNGNPTLMRFVLDAARDPELPVPLRTLSIEAAVEVLGKEAVPGLEAALLAEDPTKGNSLRFVVLDALFKVNKTRGLVETLEALPIGSGWPDEGTAFKDEIERFCDTNIASRSKKAKAPLVAALSSRNSVARLFAATCIRRLYRPEARALLAPLREDQTLIRGYSAKGEIRLSALARELN